MTTKLQLDNYYHVLVIDRDAEWRHRMAEDLGTTLVVEKLDFLPDVGKLPRRYDGAILGLSDVAADNGVHTWIHEATRQGIKIMLVTLGKSRAPHKELNRMVGGIPVLHKDNYSPESLRIMVAEQLNIPSFDPRRNITHQP